MSPYSVWGKAPAAKRFPGYYRSLRERWMRESRCYFLCNMPKKWGYGTPTPKSGGTRTGVPPVSYAYAGQRRSVGSFSAIAGLLVSLSVKLSYIQVV